MRGWLTPREGPGSWLPALLLYAVLTLVMTYPLVVDLNTHLVGTGDDMWVHYWNNWWARKALTEGRSPYTTRLLFHPQETSLVYHNFGWVNIAFWILLEPIAGGIAAANLVHLVNITLCAFAAFLLGKHLIDSWGSAFIVGLVYGFWPYRLSSYNSPNTFPMQWLPLALLCLVLVVRNRRPLRHAVLGGVFVALTGFSRWQMLLPAAITLGVYVLFSVVLRRESRSWQMVRMLLLMGLVAILLIAVPFYPLVRGLVAGKGAVALATTAEEGADDLQTDLLAYVVPPAHHPLAPLFTGLEYTPEIARFGYIPSAFLGYTVLALAVGGLVWRGEKARTWVTLALVYFALSIGPVLRLNGQVYPVVPLPYRLVGWTPPVRLMRAPHRFNAPLALPIALLAGYGAAAVGERVSSKGRSLIWGLLALLVLFDYVNVPTPMVSADVPDYYRSVAAEDGDFALVGLPGDRANTERYMFYQTLHGHPLLAGHISRLPQNALSFISSVPLLDGVYESGTIDTERPDVSHQLGLLVDAGFRSIILHKELATAEQMEAWRRYLPMQPRHEDGEVVAYPTSPVRGHDYHLRHRFDKDVGLISAHLSSEVIHPDDTLTLEINWGTTRRPGVDRRVRVALADEPRDARQSHTFSICPDWPMSQWSADAIVKGRYAVRIDPRLESGQYDVVVTLLSDTDGAPIGEPAVVGRVTMEAPARSFDEPPMEHATSATFGDTLRLLGYDRSADEEAVRVTLHWKALRRMDVAYKFFVHLEDADTGELVAQADVMPHDWTYPTTWWEEGEVVSDDISLPVGHLAPGEYRLAVGVYHPDTGERLPIRSAADLSAEDGRLWLPRLFER